MSGIHTTRIQDLLRAVYGTFCRLYLMVLKRQPVTFYVGEAIGIDSPFRTSLRNYLDLNVTEIWQNRWDASIKGRTTYLRFPGRSPDTWSTS